jgi:hypothetical protein
MSNPDCRISVSALTGIPEPAHRALAGTSSEGMPNRGDDLVGSLGLLCVWGTNLGETFGEDSPLATGIPATPTQMQPENHLRALDRKVFQRIPVTDYEDYRFAH